MVLNKSRVVSHEKDEVLRPDLCVKKDGKTMVLDAHAPYETSAKRLAIARSNKIKKYAPHADDFLKYLGCDDLKFDGVVVGARTTITQQMATKLSVLDLGPGDVESHAEEGVRRLVGYFQMVHGLEVVLHAQKEES